MDQSWKELACSLDLRQGFAVLISSLTVQHGATGTINQHHAVRHCTPDSFGRGGKEK